MAYFRTLPWKQRMFYFLLVCIPLRILIGIALWFLLDDHYPKPNVNNKSLKKGIVIVVAIISACSFTLLTGMQNDTNAWWSRQTEWAVSLAMLATSLGWLITEDRPSTFSPKWLGLIVWLDVLIGVITFLFAISNGDFQYQYIRV